MLKKLFKKVRWTPSYGIILIKTQLEEHCQKNIIFKKYIPNIKN